MDKWTYGPKAVNGDINAPWLIEERPGVVLAALWMEDEARLFTAAANAIRLATEHLGMEPLELAQLLEDGEIAELFTLYQAVYGVHEEALAHLRAALAKKGA